MISQRDFVRVDHQTLAYFGTVAKSPTSYPWKYMKGAYYAQIELVDAQIGRILDALEATGQSQNTIVIFFGDHGEMLGDHGLVLKGCRFYEGAVHVPLIFSWPGKFKSGLRSSALVELIDIAPTLLEVLSIPSPPVLCQRPRKGSP